MKEVKIERHRPQRVSKQMRYAQCKCGSRQVWSSGMSIATCNPCKKCGTVPAESPTTHPEPTPHDFSSVSKVQTDEGEKTLTRCRLCHRTQAEIDRGIEEQ